MKIAYLILAHDQPALFARLAGALAGADARLFAHIDAKTDAAPFRAAVSAHPVHFVAAPVNVNWGGYSQVAAMLSLLQLAAQHGPHDYYVFLSGRDYPLRSQRAISAHLAASGGKSYMNFYALADGVDFVDKVRRYCYYDIYARLPGRWLQRVANRLVRDISNALPARTFISGMQPYRGSTSWCLSQSVVAYLLAFVANPANQAYLKFFHSVNCADEIFFQTIVLNSPWAATLENFEEDVLRRVPGGMKNENKVSLHYIDWNPAREDPAVFDASDFPALVTSGKFFARKFDIVKSAAVLDMLDAARRADSEEN
ncbi:beta-1,6-N-acetylglucosaminyltransferase [Janthinobacterium lividum]|uniref:beta-1,6-N-acetylglucosaminyltransferase n=1 Tax=Janthinobacterium lividum TaxID=29581 RepID=UPI00140A5A9C|nr:beta-1,6-N-acetylglucosaminyltransferase [Janthinobacterium lividum]NHQ90908.1 beta-1,6-N-acetylglucosaminyltransferase [Janthinobacterium lividum]